VEICLVRHAIAVERDARGYTDDRARPLTPEGRKRMKAAAAGLRTLVKPQAILTSPVLRARQTAEILGEAFGLKQRLLEALGNGDHGATVAACQAGREQSVILVGHEPWMSELLSVLVAGSAGTAASVFRKGAAALISFDGAPAAGTGTLEWLLQPGQLRRLARPHAAP
jgi:phosphohistidine phosphatase